MTISTTEPTSQASAEEWTQLGTWTGFSFRVRPATPADASALAELFDKVSADDRRFRFLSGVQKIGQDFLDRLTRVDHERTEDFLAFDGDKLIATAMLAAEPTGQRAEVAISIHSDYKNRGLGWTLLDHVARFAASKGIELLESIESRDNREAIALEKEMGFTATAYPGDATLVLVQKKLK